MSAFCVPTRCTNPKLNLDVITEASEKPSSGWKLSCGDSKVQPQIVINPCEPSSTPSKVSTDLPRKSLLSPSSSQVWAAKSVDSKLTSATNTKVDKSVTQSSTSKEKSTEEFSVKKQSSPIQSSAWKVGSSTSKAKSDAVKEALEESILQAKQLGAQIKPHQPTQQAPVKKSWLWKAKSSDPKPETETLPVNPKKLSLKAMAFPKSNTPETREVINENPQPSVISTQKDMKVSPKRCLTPPETLSEITRAVHTTIIIMSSLGKGITNAFPPTPKPVKIWKKAVETAENTQIEKPVEGQPKTFLHLTGEEKKFVKSQPFKLMKAPPQLTPREKFVYKAKQITNQPFKFYKPHPPPLSPMSAMKAKVSELTKLAANPIFSATRKKEAKSGRFRSLAKAVLVTTQMNSLREKIRAEIEEKGLTSNEEQIKAGTHPLLKKEVLLHLFQYFGVADLKTARLVCEYWKRFSTPVLQTKSVVKLSGLCDICKSEWKSQEESIHPHDHSETISFYRFVLYTQDIPENKRYFKPFRNFKVQNINVYFIRGLSTAPTRVFLMFLKLWGDKIHEFYLKSVQLCPPDSFYRVVDCCKRLNNLVLDDIQVWLNPLSEESPLNFSMNLNYYVTSISFVTNWLGEERLHWQMILQAFPCLQEINLVDVAKTEINHCLSALLSLPQYEEELQEEFEENEQQHLTTFRQISRKISMMPFGRHATNITLESRSRNTFKTVARASAMMSSNTSRQLNEPQEDQTELIADESDVAGTKHRLRGLARAVGKQPFQLSPNSVQDLPNTSAGKGRLQSMSKKLGGLPFRQGRKNSVGPEMGEDGRSSECSPSPTEVSHISDGASSAETTKRSPFGIPKSYDQAKASPFQLPLFFATTTVTSVASAEPTEQQQASSSGDAKSRAKAAILEGAKKSSFHVPKGDLQDTVEKDSTPAPDSKFRARKAILLAAKKSPVHVPPIGLQGPEQQQEKQSKSPAEIKDNLRKALLTKAKMSPFQLSPAESDVTDSADEKPKIDPKVRARQALLQSTRKSPFNVSLVQLAEKKREEKKRILHKIQTGIKRSAINQPFTLTTSRPNAAPQIVPQKKVTFKTFAKPMMKTQFLLKGGA